MPRRRRVYVIRLEDLINDPPPPSRLKPALRAAAYAAGTQAHVSLQGR